MTKLTDPEHYNMQMVIYTKGHFSMVIGEKLSLKVKNMDKAYIHIVMD
jgi:hypothetical protein